MTERNDSDGSPATLQALTCDLASGGDRDALVAVGGDKVGRVSFRVLAAEVEALARMLSRRGIRENDPVVLCGPGGADWIVDRAILFYTSGTTRPPKGVPLTHRNIAFQIGVIAEAG
ncbi:MAG: AMP-binding protein [Tistlia sp.]|uniref:AMP-binding protein n=1 Tax=Tistlia sp. TaxID=3057121 RepID=UPI0034A2B4C3